MTQSIIEWMIEENIAISPWQAAHICEGLKLYKCDTREQQKARCLLYRAWRPKSDPKDMIPTYQAYDLAVAGIDPADVEVRQVDLAFEEKLEHYRKVGQVAEDLANDLKSFYGGAS